MKVGIFVLVACVSFPALADKQLAEKKNCLSCHGMDQKIVGPSFKEVAAKYAGQADASKLLAGNIQKGSVGTWGQIPMPANDVTAEEAKKLADWVLTVK